MNEFTECMVIGTCFTFLAVLLAALAYVTYGLILLLFVPGLIFYAWSVHTRP